MTGRIEMYLHIRVLVAIWEACKERAQHVRLLVSGYTPASSSRRDVTLEETDVLRRSSRASCLTIECSERTWAQRSLVFWESIAVAVLGLATRFRAQTVRE